MFRAFLKWNILVSPNFSFERLYVVVEAAGVACPDFGYGFVAMHVARYYGFREHIVDKESIIRPVCCESI